MERKTARLTLLIDPAKKKRFEEICAEQDVTPSQVIRKFIREYIQAHERGPAPGGDQQAAPGADE
ncbi:MAG: CopG family transcriptional regulator [Pseudomonadota bacterium]